MRAIQSLLLPLIGIGLLLGYAFDHPIAWGNACSWDQLANALLRGLAALVPVLLALLVVEKTGAGLARPGLARPGLTRPEDGSPIGHFSIGLVWFSGCATLLLCGNLLSPVTAALALLPFGRHLVRSRGGLFPCLLSGLTVGRLVVLALAGAMITTCAGAPSLTHDDHVYHLQATGEFATTGSLWTPSRQPNVYRPLASAALNAFLGQLGIDWTKPWMNAGFLVLMMILAIGRPGNAGWLTFLGWLSVPQWFFLAGSTYAEPLLCALILLLLRLLEEEQGQGPPERSLLASALVIGLLPGVKYAGLLLLPVGIAFVAGKVGSWSEIRRLAPGFLAAALVSTLATAAPFYLRNALDTGNPVFPHTRLILPGSARNQLLVGLPASGTPLVDFSYRDFTDSFGMGRTLTDLLLAPINVSLLSHFHAPNYPLVHFDGQIGFVPLLGWVLFLSQAASVGPPAAPFLFSLLWLWPVWLAGSHQIRFLLPLVAISLWAAGSSFSGKKGHLQPAFWIILFGLGCIWSIAYGLDRVGRVAPFVSGQVSREEFQRTHLPFHDAYVWANRNLQGQQLLLLLEERTFLLRCPFLWTGILPTSFANFLGTQPGATEAAGELRKLGVTHILLPRFGLEVFHALSLEERYQRVLKGFLATHLKPCYEDASYLIFALLPGEEAE